MYLIIQIILYWIMILIVSENVVNQRAKRAGQQSLLITVYKLIKMCKMSIYVQRIIISLYSLQQQQHEW